MATVAIVIKSAMNQKKEKDPKKSDQAKRHPRLVLRRCTEKIDYQRADQQHVDALDGGELLDILQALLALGYNDREAAAALKALPADVGVSEGIKMALKALA
jgi:Holliday junction resolvasome RuvABC DNA-binding subunit